MKEPIYSILNYKIERNSLNDDLERKTTTKNNYKIPPPLQYNRFIPRYNGKPANLLYGKTPVVSRPLTLDIYGDDYVDGRNTQLIDTTNKRLVEVSGYYLHPDYVDKTALKTTQNLKVVGVLI